MSLQFAPQPKTAGAVDFALDEQGDLIEDDGLLSAVYFTLYAGSSPLDVLKGSEAQSDEFLERVNSVRLTPSGLKAMSAAANSTLSPLVGAGFARSMQADCRNLEGDMVAVLVSGELKNGGAFGVEL